MASSQNLVSCYTDRILPSLPARIFPLPDSDVPEDSEDEDLGDVFERDEDDNGYEEPDLETIHCLTRRLVTAIHTVQYVVDDVKAFTASGC
ncbi:hypothetical protein H9Q72_008535 [Fusarium xylarioides]|uniref:Uncharacterized protein n=1 Tax=Fusarium xylarioides TaxID=221167 RepID=A0A9P7LFL8_9HYPO|nr:hypothetical protein H9Q70_006279 [Fusarium xylarioides]KAG5763354.1 hypothetical protein H9Q72_008535 [Fusarium xylarioides]KAG5780003.1 hypothetical protein H9Q73_006313 [Fusarium xylarioides]KAG5811053.1 hypothetical protein H9Q71_005098 [Fusarium xylarioides]KAG5823266.1 hypothetical protein H9Q74_006648 [Fusarium xylarioides]